MRRREKGLSWYFSTQEEASNAYRDAKKREADRWYTRLKSGEFIVDDRVTERMRVWRLQ